MLYMSEMAKMRYPLILAVDVSLWYIGQNTNKIIKIIEGSKWFDVSWMTYKQ